jgi:uncharacterized protein YjbI with pentapeptide repeats
MSEMKTLLDRALSLHKQWRLSDGKEGERFELTGADLQQAVLKNMNFSMADFTGSVFNDAILIDATIDYAGIETGEVIRLTSESMPRFLNMLKEHMEADQRYAEAMEDHLRQKKADLRLVKSNAKDKPKEKPKDKPKVKPKVKPKDKE